MDVAGFLSSYAGAYVTQSLVHAFIAAIITDRAINAWEVRSSSIVQRFRLIVVILPLVSFPIYQLLNPERGSVGFRLQALFDSQRWLNVELWGKLPISAVFLLVVALTALVFLVQELIPVATHMWAARNPLPAHEGRTHPVVNQALATIPGEKPPILVMDDDDHVVFSTVGGNSAIFLSSGLLKALTVEELRAAVAHEIAHVARNRRPLLASVFILRTLMFYNPVTLLEFRKIVHEEEKICDDLAVALTGDRHALAATLRKLYGKSRPPELGHLFRPAEWRESLEEHGHHVLLEDRIQRLEHEQGSDDDPQWLTLLVTVHDWRNQLFRGMRRGYMPMPRVAIKSLVFAATVAVVVVVLMAVNWLPTALEDGLLRPYASVEEVKHSLRLRELYVPSYFPQRLAWPPARILAQSKPHIAVIMEIKDRERGETALVISQSERAPIYSDQKLAISKVSETLAYRLKGRSTVLEVGVCGESETCSRIAWTEGMFHIAAVMRSPPAELLRIADSMID